MTGTRLHYGVQTTALKYRWLASRNRMGLSGTRTYFSVPQTPSGPEMPGTHVETQRDALELTEYEREMIQEVAGCWCAHSVKLCGNGLRCCRVKEIGEETASTFVAGKRR
jgi:hypothetical protein